MQDSNRLDTVGRSNVRRAAIIAVIFAAIYAASLGPDPLNIHWFNLVFDADPSRVQQDALVGQDAATFDRHPLFGILVGAPSRLLQLIGVANPVWLVVALLGGVGVGLAFLVFVRICGNATAATLFAVLYGSAPPIWLLSALPETFALTAGLMLALILRRRTAEGSSRAQRAVDAVIAAASVGIAVPNAVYVMIAQIRKAASKKVLLTFAGTAVAAYALLGLLQAVVIPGSRNVLVAPVRAVIGDPYVREANAPSFMTVLGNLSDFMINALVAPAPMMKIVPTTLGPMQMLQFGGFRVTWVLGVALLVGAIVALMAKTPAMSKVWRNDVVRVALAFLAFNIAFHALYRANGQPFIFTTHTVGPVLILIAALYAASELPRRRTVLAALTAVVVVNNALFIRDIRQVLTAPCESRIGLVCVKWSDPRHQARYGEGIEQFLASGDYPFELARTALERGAYPDATKHLLRALSIQPDHRLAVQYLGFTYLRAGRPADAVPWLERASAEQPRNAVVQSLLRQARAATLEAPGP